MVMKKDEKKERIMRVMDKIGVIMKKGMGINVDGKDIGREYLVRCFEDG